MHKKELFKVMALVMVFLIVVNFNITFNYKDDTGSGSFIKLGSKAYASTNTTTVAFDSSTARNRSKTTTISGLDSVTSVTVNTGSVTYSVSGEKVTVSVSGGTATSTVTPSKAASGSKISDINSFPATMTYNDGTYSGTLSKDGASFVTSGSPAGSKTATAYSAVNTVTSTGWTNPWQMTGASDSNPAPATYYYNSDGYTGTLPRLTGSAGTIVPANPDHGIYHWGATVGGRTAWSCHSYFQAVYQGTVTKPDTRMYKQKYTGTVTAAPVNYYAYTVTVTYTKKSTPTPAPTPAPTLKPPGISEPVNNILIPCGYITLCWKDTSGESSYQITIVDETSGATIVNGVSKPANTTSYVVPDSLITKSHKYKWFVSAVGAGSHTYPSANQYFTTEEYDSTDDPHTNHTGGYTSSVSDLRYVIDAKGDYNYQEKIMKKGAEMWNGITNSVHLTNKLEGQRLTLIKGDEVVGNPDRAGETAVYLGTEQQDMNLTQPWDSAWCTIYDTAIENIKEEIEKHVKIDTYKKSVVAHEVGHALGLLHTDKNADYRYELPTKEIMDMGILGAYTVTSIDKQHLRMIWGWT